MSKFGILSYLNNSGIGNIAKEFRQYLNVEDFFIVNFPQKPTRKDWLNGGEYFGTKPTHQTEEKEIREWFSQSKIDKLLIIETPFNWKLFDIAREFGIKVYALIHWECFRPTKEWHKAELLISHTKFGYEFLKKEGYKNIQYIPYPINTKYLQFRERRKIETLLFPCGFGGVNERKNIEAVLEAHKHINKKLIITTQKELNIDTNNIDNIEIKTGEVSEYKDIYKEGDLVLYPTKYEGLGLCILEAMACGIPVLTTNSAPMNEYIREPELLIDVARQENFTIYHTFKGNIIDIKNMIQKTNALLDKDISVLSRKMRQRIEEEFSWDAMGEQYLKVFNL